MGVPWWMVQHCMKCCKTFSPKRQDLGTFLNYLKNTLLKLSRSREKGNMWKGHVVITDVSVLQSSFLFQLTQSVVLALFLVFKCSVLLPFATRSAGSRWSIPPLWLLTTIWKEYNPIQCYILSGLQTGRGDNSKLCELHFFISLMLLLLFHCG